MAKPLILFVHGLGGDSTATWGNFPKFLAEDSDIGQRVDVGFYGYPTSVVRFAFFPVSLKIQDLAKSLKTDIEIRYGDRSEIILVAHSMGCIVCQKYLIDELNADRPTRVKAIALYAPPTFGSKLAKFGTLFSWKHRHLWQLRGGSDLLQSIREVWAGVCDRHNLPTAHVLGGQDAVVIAPPVPDPNVRLIADRGHSDLVKPVGANDLAFLILKELVTRTVVKQQNLDDTRPAVLFDVYQARYEKFYKQRREDTVLSENMRWKHLWIFGPSGFGKTAALMRALSQSDPNYRYISLGHYSGCDAKGLLAALAANLEMTGLAQLPLELDWPALTSLLVDKLEAALGAGIRWILIEELPLTTENEFQEFFARLCVVLLLLATRNQQKSISLALSSVLDPRKGFSSMERMAQTLKIMRFGSWRTDDLRSLVHLISKELNLLLTAPNVEALLETAKGSPRFVKVFFANLLALSALGNVTFEECLSQTCQELPS